MAGGTFEGGVVGRGGIHDARVSHSIRALRSPLVASSVAVVVCVVVLVAGVNRVQVDAEALDGATLTLGVISRALFLGAGIVQLARWRITCGRQELYWGSALIVLGGVSLPLTTLAAVISADMENALLPPLTSVSVALVAATLMILGLGAQSTSGAHRAPLVLVAASAAAALMFGALTTLHFATSELMHTQSLPATALRGAVLSMVWAGIALFRSTRLGP